MKKVLFVATVESHIIHFHIDHLKLFKQYGYEVHVVARGKSKIEYCDKHFDIPFERTPLRINNIKAYKQLKKLINENEYEIIHCHTPVGGVIARLAAKKARSKGTKVFYTAHGFHFYKGASLLNWLLYYTVEKYLSKYTDCLITINQEDYEKAKQKFKKCKKVELINGIGLNTNKFDFEMSNDEKKNLKKDLGFNENDFIIIYIAELSKRKNQGMLIRTLKKINEEKIKNIKILLVGIDSMKGRYQQLAKRLNMYEDVRFLGYRKDIPKLLKISDLSVSTSKQEGLPVNIMESMYTGLPIIVKDCRGNRDLIKDGRNGYVIKNEIELKERIIMLLKNREIVNKLILNNKSDIKQYLLETIEEKMKIVYGFQE